MANKISVESRRKKIFQLINRGMNREEISNHLDVRMRTLDRDLSILKKELVKTVSKETSETALVTLLERSKDRVKRLWAIIIGKTTTDVDKIRAMRQIEREDENTERRMERLGIIPPRPRDDASLRIEAAEGASVEVTQENKTINFHWGTKEQYEKDLKKLKEGKK